MDERARQNYGIALSTLKCPSGKVSTSSGEQGIRKMQRIVGLPLLGCGTCAPRDRGNHPYDSVVSLFLIPRCRRPSSDVVLGSNNGSRPVSRC